MSASTLASNVNTINPGPWQYNAMIHIISHETHTCKTCAVWARHYMLSALDKEPSLAAAEGQRETTILSHIVADHTRLQHEHDMLQQAHTNMQLNNTSLQQTNASLLREIDAVRIELANTRDDLDGACH